jgi:cell wall assembly regulator SMI1
MLVYLDDQRVDCPGLTPMHALDTARAAAATSGRLIIEVRVDGELWDGDADAAVAGRPAAMVAFRTVEPKVLVRSAWRDLVELSGSVAQAQQDTAAKLQAGDIPGAMSELHGVLEAWQTIQRGVCEGAALLSVEPEEVLAGVTTTTGKDGSTLFPELVVELKKIHQAVSDQNWPDLADFLLDEMGDVAESWRTTLSTLEARLA